MTLRSSAVRDAVTRARVETLIDMLTTCRPMGSATETAFRERYLLSLPNAVTDPFGNIHIVIARPDGTASRVLWSCHTDTVHRHDGYQQLAVSRRRIALADREYRSNCLGADDTVGVWLMRELILARVPGHYVFHYGEERGGVGSRQVVWQEPDRFDAIQCAIAFDRRGKRDVITHQSYGRTCSDAFAKSLCRQLRSAARYKPSDRGIYTDTAEYACLIPECTNVSVGYKHEHTRDEYVDYQHALALLAALLRIDETQLTIDRVPGSDDDDDDIDDLILQWEKDRDSLPVVDVDKSRRYDGLLRAELDDYSDYYVDRSGHWRKFDKQTIIDIDDRDRDDWFSRFDWPGTSKDGKKGFGKV